MFIQNSKWNLSFIKYLLNNFTLKKYRYLYSYQLFHILLRKIDIILDPRDQPERRRNNTYLGTLNHIELKQISWTEVIVIIIHEIHPMRYFVLSILTLQITLGVPRTPMHPLSGPKLPRSALHCAGPKTGRPSFLGLQPNTFWLPPDWASDQLTTVPTCPTYLLPE